ncbi:hypothetical protein B0T09DRAFT_329491, partial [Sordaria sp. MPI-SDFR-AT-0083]
MMMIPHLPFSPVCIVSHALLYARSVAACSLLASCLLLMKVEVEVKNAISDNYDDANLSSSSSSSQQVAISFFRAASYFVAVFFFFF